MTRAADGDIAEILAEFGGNPQRAEGLAAYLGFEPVPNPEDRLAGMLSGGLKQYLRGRDEQNYGVSELYRVGHRKAAPAEAGLYIGVLSDWGYRSTDRDRPRRRVTRALVEQVTDRRSLALLVPPPGDARREAELVFPRTQVGSSKGAVTSVRAHLDLNDPTRFHRDLLRGLRVPPGANLLEVSRAWQQEFSVERVTTKFYQEYAAVRDRIAEALLAHNRDHPVVKSFTQDEARAWATRQMGRVLFLWFLQAKQWLGEPGGRGSATYLRDLWHKRADAEGGEYYRGILVPMFFDAMATGSSSRNDHPILGYVPYLNGGLFRRNALEDRIHDAEEVSLPDEVFDPYPDEDDDLDDEEGRDKTLLGLLSRYRFTTRESTPDDQSVDPDPELLGRVFENLYQGDERHDTGTYYTPREIVQFMCREALDGYLRDATGVEQSTLNVLRQEAVGSRDEYESIPDVPADALIDALETVRVCDPAVGSGAFLLGALQEIVALRRGILFSQTSYVDPHELYRMVSEWKRRIIENSLYGVDINPEAVEICRLRLWLSMVLDMDDPPVPDSDWALPNLDFQIVAGDSLVDRVAGVTFKESWPTPETLQLGMELQGSLQRLENNIAQRRREFQGTHKNPRRLRELRDLIARDQREIVRLHLEDALDRAETELEALLKALEESKRRLTTTALRKAESLIDRMRSLLNNLKSTDFALVQKPFLWPVAFPEVLREGDSNAGFDIVLANPPYVRQERLDAEDQRSYEEAFSSIHVGTADILVYFYARALQILRPGGWLSFITSNSFTKRKYGEKLRGYLPQTLRVTRLIDFGEISLFDATVEPYVLVGHRTPPNLCETVAGHNLYIPLTRTLGGRGSVERVREELHGLPEYLENEVSHFPQRRLTYSEWRIENEDTNVLFERLMNQGTPLDEFVDGRIYVGVKTGLNKAFAIDQYKRDELITEDPGSSEVIKPWLRGGEIKRWTSGSTGHYLIALQNSGDAGASHPWAEAKSNEEARNIFSKTYPAIHDHLSWFERGLRARRDQGRFWWELRACAYYHEFEREKIIWPDIARQIRFASEAGGIYPDVTCFMIPTDSRWLLALMNSTLHEFLVCQITNSLPGGFLRPKRSWMARLPIVTPDGEMQAELEALTNEILGLGDSSEQKEAIEREIDAIVFHVYGLSALDRKLVLDWLGERREALGAEMPPDWRKLNALWASVGAWRGNVDADELLRDIRASRDIDTRPVPRL